MSLAITPAASIVSILLVATLLCRLKMRTDGFYKWQHIWLRIKSWWLITILVLPCLYLGPLAVTVLFTGVAATAIFEFLNLRSAIARQNISFYYRSGWVLLCCLLMLCSYISPYWNAGYCCALMIILWLTMIISAGTKSRLGDITGVLYLSLSLSFIPALARQNFLNPDLENTVFFLLFITGLNDVSQYIAGKIFGGKKLAPIISPNKTWSGAIGGMITTALICGLVGPCLLGLSATNCFLIGLILSVVGIIGDLTISLLKRSAMVTNTGSLLPGHGGILDRVDSLCLTAPAFYFLLYLERII